MTDPEIVSLYWKRDDSAIKHTQSKYNAYLTRISYNILTNLEDCSEAVNDTYLAHGIPCRTTDRKSSRHTLVR